MPRRRLFAKLFVTYALVILLSVATVWVVLSLQRNKAERLQLERQLRSMAYLVDERLALLRDQPDLDDLDRQTKALGRTAGLRITLVDARGTVLADSEGDPGSMENHAFRPEIQEAMGSGTGSSLRTSTTVRKSLLYVAVRSRVASGGVTRVAAPLEQLENRIQASRNALLAGIGAAALVSLALGAFLARTITRPLVRMRRNLERLETGELGVRLEVETSDELGLLAQTLNRIQGQLESTIQSLTVRHNEREAILSGMLEGLVAVDEEQRLVMLNRAASEMLGIDSATVEGRPLVEVVRRPVLVELVSAICHDCQPSTAELVLPDRGERCLELHGAPLRFGTRERVGAVVVLNDVTQLRKLEKTRKDFVANVSHELKTPITSIKGFLETLLDGGALAEPASARRFLGIIMRHANRLHAIVDDLLYLSRLEYEGAEFPKQPTNLALVATNSVANFEHQSRQQNIKLHLHVKAQPLHVIGEARLLARAVDNLVENAIKYSSAGRRVDVVVRRDDTDIVLEVRDEGIGIPEEHLARISERFYRVDKARSRDVGGTGLGLAIVKHIAMVHGGTLSVQSTLGEGSCFTIRLPAADGVGPAEAESV